MPRARTPAPPKDYYSYRHPDFGRAEWRFALVDPSTPQTEDVTLLHRLEEALSDPVQADAGVFTAIESLGPSALRPPPAQFIDDNESSGTVLRAVVALVWDRIGSWYEVSRSVHAPPDERRAASASLRKLGSALAPDLRGRRGVDPWEVVHTYRRYLFRLERVRELLRVWPCPTSSLREKIELVAKACGLPTEEVLEFLNVDADGRPRVNEDSGARPRGGTVPADLQAQTWTGRTFKITAQRVENILSEWRAGRPDTRRGRSRK